MLVVVELGTECIADIVGVGYKLYFVIDADVSSELDNSGSQPEYFGVNSEGRLLDFDSYCDLIVCFADKHYLCMMIELWTAGILAEYHNRHIHRIVLLPIRISS